MWFSKPTVGLTVVLIALVFASGGLADVVKVYGSKIIPYQDDQGRTRQQVIKKADITLPAEVQSNVSRKGLLRVKFNTKAGAITGWVKKRKVKLDPPVAVDTSCGGGPPGAQIALGGGRVHASRGSGKGC